MARQYVPNRDIADVAGLSNVKSPQKNERMGGRVDEGGSLENCCTPTGTLGSNPSPSVFTLASNRSVSFSPANIGVGISGCESLQLETATNCFGFCFALDGSIVITDSGIATTTLRCPNPWHAALIATQPPTYTQRQACDRHTRLAKMH